MGGSPCESFSIAGKKKGFDDDRGQLFFEFVRILKETKPKFFIFENVKNLKDNSSDFKIITESFKNCGYRIFHKIMNTQDYGVPQMRKRLYIVGFLNHNINFEFQKELELKLSIWDILQPQLPSKYFLNKKMVKYFKTLHDENIKCGIIQRGRGFNKGNYFIKLCPTITASFWEQNNILFFEGEYRKLTPRECARLQGFREDFIFPMKVSNSQRYKQMGKAMSYCVVETIAEKIKEIMCKKPK